MQGVDYAVISVMTCIELETAGIVTQLLMLFCQDADGVKRRVNREQYIKNLVLKVIQKLTLFEIQSWKPWILILDSSDKDLI